MLFQDVITRVMYGFPRNDIKHRLGRNEILGAEIDMVEGSKDLETNQEELGEFLFTRFLFLINRTKK